MEKIIAALNRLLPDFVVQPVSQGDGRIRSTRIELPAAVDAEYFFELWILPERQIGARLIEAGEDCNYFWYVPFEDADYSGSTEMLDKHFCETVEKLLTHNTRIIYRSGWLSWQFRCDYEAQGGWKKVSYNSTLKLAGWKVPRLAGKSRIYRSPALVRNP
ncbi:MAG: hypothetical protein WB566_00200 [Terriglobales bacterium]